METVKYLLNATRKLLAKLKIINYEPPVERKKLTNAGRKASLTSCKTTYKEHKCTLAITFELSIIPKFIVKFTRDWFSKVK